MVADDKLSFIVHLLLSFQSPLSQTRACSAHHNSKMAGCLPSLFFMWRVFYPFPARAGTSLGKSSKVSSFEHALSAPETVQRHPHRFTLVIIIIPLRNKYSLITGRKKGVEYRITKGRSLNGS